MIRQDSHIRRGGILLLPRLLGPRAAPAPPDQSVRKKETALQHLKVYVYAICKNEEAFAARWYESMKEADGVCVLDTGSSDQTVSVLRGLGASVESAVIDPWRFDDARNRSLALVPEDADICVCTDLDEVFRAGWREHMERAWTDGVSLLHYRYTWNFLENGQEGVVFWIGKAHARHGYRWVNPVHEVLEHTKDTPSPYRVAEGVQLDHLPDHSKSRSSYLPLLELAVEENPDNDRNMHYLGREYMFYGMWEKCRETLLRHLSLPSAVWKPERCASMRYIAIACEQLQQDAEAERWHFLSIAEAPELREPWLETARFFLKKKDWLGAAWFAERTLAITERTYYYMNSQKAWLEEPYDVASLGYYYLSKETDPKARALELVKKALEFAPGDSRLLANLRFME
ncbi:MAG: glycosyl transferase family 2 [Eubacteriales bacterium]|nr:glycosyl transferase family 2 [Eubacteriales bacterium]